MVAIAMILMTAIAATLANRRRHDAPKIWWSLAALGAVSAALMFPFSGFIWVLLPKLRFVQFPWRWLMPLGVAFAMFAAAAVARWHKRWIGWIVLAVALGSAAVLIARDAWWDSEDIPQTETAIQSGSGYEGTDEYQPMASDRSDLQIAAPRLAGHRCSRQHRREFRESSCQSIGPRFSLSYRAMESRGSNRHN